MGKKHFFFIFFSNSIFFIFFLLSYRYRYRIVIVFLHGLSFSYRIVFENLYRFTSISEHKPRR
jgi:hypothetical protein